MPNTYDGTFLLKCLRARNHQLFSEKNSIIYVWRGSNHSLLAVSLPCIVNNIIWRYRNSSSKISLEKYLPSDLQLYKKETPTQVFSCEIWTLFSTENLRSLLFKVKNSNNHFKDFKALSFRHNKSLITCNSHKKKLIWNLKMHSHTKNLFW